MKIVPDAIKTAVRNNGGGARNHSLFSRRSLAPAGKRRRRQANRQLRQGDRFDVRLVRQIQGIVRRCGHQAVWLGLGVARQEWR